MIVSLNPSVLSRRSPMWAFVALAWLPLGAVRAQEPDYEAVSERLLEAVHEGELSAQQAEAMLGELARARFRERLAESEHEDEGWDVEAHFRELGLDDDLVDRVYNHLDELGLEEEQADGVMELVCKALFEWAESGVDPSQSLEADAEVPARWFADAVRELGLSAAQVERVRNLPRRLAAHRTRGRDEPRQVEEERRVEHLVEGFYALGVGDEQLGRLKEAFEAAGICAEGGLSEAQEWAAWGGTLRLVRALRDDPDLELNERMYAHFSERVGLSEDQLELLWGAARRLAAEGGED